jgi:hypothetical protein
VTNNSTSIFALKGLSEFGVSFTVLRGLPLRITNPTIQYFIFLGERDTDTYWENNDEIPVPVK